MYDFWYACYALHTQALCRYAAHTRQIHFSKAAKCP